MANLGEFSRRIEIIAGKIPEKTNEIVRATALAIDEVLVQATPVDTGRARSNWLAGLGSPSRELRETLGQSASQLAIEEARLIISQRRVGQDIFLSNNLPYISRLNEGYSSQAPAGFVEKAIQTGVEIVRKSKVLK